MYTVFINIRYDRWEENILQSKVLSMFPFEQVDLTPFKRRPEIDEAKLQKELDRVVYPYITWEEGEEAAPGDVLTCRMESENERFRRAEAKITVGVGLLDKQEEQKLVGARVGNVRTLTCRGSEVTVTVLGIRKRCVPPLRDEMVEALGLDGVHTVEQYRQSLVDQALDEQFTHDSYEVVQAVLHTVRQRSEVLISQEDWQQCVDWDLNRLAVLSALDGMDLKTMTAEDFEGRIPVKSYYELVAMLQHDAWQNTWQLLMGRKLAETDGFAVTREGYEAFLKESAEAWHHTADDYRPAYSYEYYEAIQYRIHYYDAVSGYIREHLYQED